MNIKLGSYLKKSTSTGLCNSIGSAVFSVILIPLIIGRIGMENYGVWATLMIFIGLSGTADLGLSKSLVYYIPKQKTIEEKDEICTAGLIINCLVILILAAIGISVYLSGINIWGSNESISSGAGLQLLLCGTIILCCSLGTTFCRSLLESYYKIYLVNAGFLLLTILNYSTVYILSFYTSKVEYLIMITTGVYVFTLLLHIIFVRLATDVSFRRPSIKIIRDVSKYSMGFFTIGVLTSIILPANRYLFVLFANDTKAYGIFDVALKISLISLSFLQAFAVPLYSVFSSYGKEKIEQTKKILNHYFWILSCAYLAGCLIFWAIGKRLLNFWVGTDSNELYYISMIMICGVGVCGIAEPYIRGLWALGHIKLCIELRLVSAIVNFLFIFTVTGITALYRIGIAYSLALGVNAILLIISFRIKYPDRKETASERKDYTLPAREAKIWSMDSRVNILQVIDTLNPFGGTAAKLLHQVRNSNGKVKFTICCTCRAGQMAEKFRREGVEIIELNGRKNYDIRQIFDIRRVIREKNIDIVHTHFARANTFGRIAAFLSGKPVMVSEHGILRNTNPLVTFFDNILNLFTRYNVSNSRATMESVKKTIYLNRKNMSVIHNGVPDNFNGNSKVNRNETRKKYGLGKDDFVILEIGGQIALRSQRTIIDAVESLKDTIPNIKAVLIGDGPLHKSLTKYVSERGLEKYVFLPGYVERDDVYELMQASDIYVNATVKEGFGFAMAEAMLAGLSVTGADAGSIPEIIDDDVNGLLFEPGNAEALSECIIKLYESEELRRKTGLAGRGKILEEFNIEKFVKSFEDKYLSMVKL